MQVSTMFADQLTRRACSTCMWHCTLRIKCMFVLQEPHTLQMNPLHACRADEMLLHTPEDVATLIGGVSAAEGGVCVLVYCSMSLMVYHHICSGCHFCSCHSGWALPVSVATQLAFVSVIASMVQHCQAEFIACRTSQSDEPDTTTSPLQDSIRCCCNTSHHVLGRDMQLCPKLYVYTEG